MLLKGKAFGQGTAIYLAAITGLAFALRVARLDLQPLWWDEGYSVFFATRDLVTMLTRTAVDIHPPLYYALLQAWMALAGKSDVVLRLFSVLVGVATVPIIYLIGRRLFNWRVAALAALLLAISPLQIYYSQEVRMYGLVTLLALVSIAIQLFILRSVQLVDDSSNAQTTGVRWVLSASSRQWPGAGGTPRRLTWLAYIIVTAAALYAEYYAAFIIAAEIVIVLYLEDRRGKHGLAKDTLDARDLPVTTSISSERPPIIQVSRRPRRTSVRTWIWAWLAIFVLYLPWLLYAGSKLYVYVTAKVGIENYSSLDPVTFLAQHLTAFSVGHLSKFTWLQWSTLLFIGLAALGILYALRRRNHSNGNGPGTAERGTTELPIAQKLDESTASQNLLIYLFVPLLCGWVVNLAYAFNPIRYERSLLFAAPMFYLLVALGLARLLKNQTGLAYAALAAIVLISAASLYDFYTVPRYPDEDYRPLIREMEVLAQPGDVVLAPYPWQIGYLESYYHGAPLRTVEVPSDQWTNQPGQMDRALTLIRASTTRVWLLAYQIKGRILEDQIANFFADTYPLADDWFVNTRLQYFAQGADPPMTEAALEFAPDLKLVSYGVGTEPFTAGVGFIRLRLHWQAGSDTYSYSLRLVDGRGEKKIQEDAPIVAGNEIERRGLALLQDLPGGEYELRMVVYRRVDASALALPDGKSEITLGRIRVNLP